MTSLFDTLTQQVSGAPVQRISDQLGLDQEAVGKVVAGALPLLMGALNRNTNDPRGARSLHQALERDHDGSLLDNLGGFLQSASTGPGQGILRHVFGSRQEPVEKTLSGMSGLDMQTVAKILSMLAPIVMAALGRVRAQQNLDPDGLSQLLEGEEEQVRRKAPEAQDLLGSLLDSDKDGQIMDDVANLGAGLLGKFLGSRR